MKEIVIIFLMSLLAIYAIGRSYDD